MCISSQSTSIVLSLHGYHILQASHLISLSSPGVACTTHLQDVFQPPPPSSSFERMSIATGFTSVKVRMVMKSDWPYSTSKTCRVMAYPQMSKAFPSHIPRVYPFSFGANLHNCPKRRDFSLTSSSGVPFTLSDVLLPSVTCLMSRASSLPSNSFKMMSVATRIAIVEVRMVMKSNCLHHE